MFSGVVGLAEYGSDSEEGEEEEEEVDSDEDLEERIRQKKEAYERKIREEGIYNEDELGRHHCLAWVYLLKFSDFYVFTDIFSMNYIMNCLDFFSI